MTIYAEKSSFSNYLFFTHIILKKFYEKKLIKKLKKVFDDKH